MNPHIPIEAVSPPVDGGHYAAKAVCGGDRRVEADIFRDGHAVPRAVVKGRRKRDRSLRESPIDLVHSAGGLHGHCSRGHAGSAPAHIFRVTRRSA